MFSIKAFGAPGNITGAIGDTQYSPWRDRDKRSRTDLGFVQGSDILAEKRWTSPSILATFRSLSCRHYHQGKTSLYKLDMSLSEIGSTDIDGV